MKALLVRFIAVHGIYFGRRSSPLGRNAQFYCERFNSSLLLFSVIIKVYYKQSYGKSTRW